MIFLALIRSSFVGIVNNFVFKKFTIWRDNFCFWSRLIFRFRQCCCCWGDMKSLLLRWLPRVIAFVFLLPTWGVLLVCNHLWFFFCNIHRLQLEVLEDWINRKGRVLWVILGKKGKKDVLIKRSDILFRRKLHFGNTTSFISLKIMLEVLVKWNSAMFDVPWLITSRPHQFLLCL